MNQTITEGKLVDLVPEIYDRNKNKNYTTFMKSEEISTSLLRVSDVDCKAYYRLRLNTNGTTIIMTEKPN